jgi:hypothetical protein
MIKIQPAHSRILKSESPDRLTLTCPAKGLLSAGGLLLVIGLVWIAVMVLVLLEIEDKIVQIGAGFLLLPALIMGLSGAAMCVHRWSFERTPAMVFFRRGGLLGTRTRKWSAEDVSSFWVDVREPHQGGAELIIGFRNGRSEQLLVGYAEEDFQWVAALMKDPRGDRRPVPATARVAAEPVPPRRDHSIEPATVVVRMFSSGVEMTFLPLLHFRRRWWKLLAEAVLGVFTIVILAQILVRVLANYPAWITRVVIALWLVLILGRLAILLQATVIQVLDGIVTIVQSQHRGNFQFAVGDVEYVQTFRTPARTELQILLRGRPKVRVLHDRPAEELEWAARFLRVAIKGRAPEEAASMKVEAAAGECQVCGEKMESRVIFCAKCRTPHHEECWSYVGQCSTFGCREIRFTRT